MTFRIPKIRRRRDALTLKLLVALGCASALASCGNAQNPKNSAALVQQLQNKVNSLNGQLGGKLNPATNQPVTSGNTVINGIWVSNCIPGTNATSGNLLPGAGSYQEVYMFQGSAWYVLFAFWDDTVSDDGGCGNDGSDTLVVGGDFAPAPNGFNAGYIANPTAITTNVAATLNLVAWTGAGSAGQSYGSWGNTSSMTSFSLAISLQTGPTTANGGYGAMTIGDFLAGTPQSPTLAMGIWDGN